MVNSAPITATVSEQFLTQRSKVNVLSIGFFVLTAAALIYGIANNRLQMKKLREENEKMKELEHNLKGILGDRYQTIP